MDNELFDPAQFNIDLAAAHSPTRAFKKALQHADGVLKARFEGQRDIHKLIHDRAWLTDQILCQAWITLACPLDAEIALLAAGGYGRCELHPHSDIDLLILLRDGSSGERYHESISRFLTLLWDIGLEVGHSVRSISECQHEARADVTVITNLMESRILIGEPQLRQDMIDALGPQYMWTSAEFFRAKRAEQHARHAKFNDTEYNLEPNVKGSPGGLRDIQTIGWVALRHFGTNDLRQLVDQGFLNESEYSILTNGRAFLWQVRFALHTLANRAEDRLLFDHQRALARLFGFEDNDAKLAVERFMQKYYRIVMSLSELNDLLMQHFEEILLRDAEAADIQPLNERFQIRNHYIEVTHPQVFKRTPFALLEIFLLMAQHQEIRGVRADTIRLLRDNRHLIDDDFRSDTRNTGLFMELLRCREGVHRNVRRMSRYGILGRYLPEFGRIVGQMQHDLFHIYTVDAHTLNLIKHLRKLEQPDYQEKYPLAWKIFCRLPKPDLLYIAGLYHDIAKGRGGDHSELGAIDANLFCQRHQLPAWDTHLVCWLVEHHLLMSTTAQRKDIADPEVIHDFAVQMDNQVRLDYLYVLTIADINATNPNLWNSWRASLLRQLYTETKRALRRGLDNPPNRAEQISDTQRAAMDILVRNGIDEEDTESLWTQLDDSYFLRHTASDIAWQTEAILQHPRHRGPLVLIKETAQREFEGATQIFLYTSEQHDLFAVTVAAMDQLNLSIQDARVIATNNINLGTYIVLDADGGPIGDNPERIREIKRELNEVLSDPEIHPSIIQRRVPRQLKHFAFAPEVTIFTDHGGQHTTLELSAPDRPGLLAKMGKIFLDFDISVQNARIVTLGERVDDVFVLTDADNQPLSDPQLCQRLQNTIIRTLSYNIEQPDQDTPQSMDI